MTERVVLSLDRAPDDADLFSSEYQKELRHFSSQMQFHSQRAFAMDSVDGGGGPLGEFIFTNATALITSVTTVAVSWIAAKKGRRVRLKVGDVEVEASDIDEVKKLLELAKTYIPEKPTDSKKK